MATKPTANQDLVISYRLLRKALGVIAIAMPFVLAFGAYAYEGVPWAGSVSAYYYTSMRDVFVGTMFAIGVFLCCYRGYDRLDNVLTSVAGFAAAAIGLLPMEPEYSKVLMSKYGGVGDPMCYLPHLPFGFHFAAAATFFAVVSYLVTFRFTLSDQSPPAPAKHARNRVYRVCGAIMMACLATIGILKWRAPQASIVVPEIGAIVAFAVAWLTKGEAILPD
jgi:hypothetical protein